MSSQFPDMLTPEKRKEKKESRTNLEIYSAAMPQPGTAMCPGQQQYSPLPDVGVHRLGKDGRRGLGDCGVGLKSFYLQEEVCTGETPNQGH